MVRLAISGLVCCLLILVDAAEAQIVRVGPGGGVSVAAPFVRVEVAPGGGGTQVRAPFTSVYTPGYRGRYPRGPLAGSRFRPLEETNVTLMNWQELRRHTRVVAGRFENELSRTVDGQTWRSSLRPGTVRDLLAEDVNQPPDPATLDQLVAILQSYDALAGSNGYPQIAGLRGFQDMRQALVELTMPPRQRDRQILAAHWTAFHHDLGRFETGGTWQSYLALPPEIANSNTPTPAAGATQKSREPDVRQLEEILSRYEEVIGPEEYRAVAQLPSFQATRQHLAGYVQLLKREASKPAIGLQPLPEGIPAPRPMQ